jgi:site-specific DNA-adenine methylase
MNNKTARNGRGLSIFPYYGGKARMAALIADRLNYNDTQIYVEPFCGGCRTLLAKPRHGVEMVCDIDEGINALIGALANPDTARELIYRLSRTEYSKDEFDRAKRIYDSGKKGVYGRVKEYLDEQVREIEAKLRNCDPKEKKELCDALRHLLQFYEMDKKAWAEAEDLTMSAADHADFELKLAVSTYVVYTQSRDAMGKIWSGRKNPELYKKRMERLWSCAERLEGVELMSTDATHLFYCLGDGSYFFDWLQDPRVMFYLDPSYISPESEGALLEGIDAEKENSLSDAIERRCGEGKLPANLGGVYVKSFGYREQENFVASVADARCKVMISNYDLILYKKYLTEEKGWKSFRFLTKTSVGGKADNTRVEVCYYNY